MIQENIQLEQNIKKSNLKESQKTIGVINDLNIEQLPENNNEKEKEDSLLKNNKLENPRYKNNDNESGALFPIHKKISADINSKNVLKEDEEDEEWENPLSKKNVLTSQKKVFPKQNILSLLKSNVINNDKKDNKDNSDNAEKFSVVVNKNENSFDYEDNNNNINNNNNNQLDVIQSGSIKNPINNIIPKLNELKNNNIQNEQLEKEPQNNDINNIQQLKKDLFDKKDKKDKKVKKCCLKNYGDTSYLNTILQCLANVEILKNFFLNKNIENYLKSNVKGLPLSFVTQRVFNHFYVKRDEKYTVESFLRVLGSLNIIYSATKSRNVNECLIFILDRLLNELNRIKNGNQKNDFDKTNRKEVINYGIMNYKNKYDCIISDIFNWKEIKELHCTECGKISYEFHTYNTFQLDSLNSKNIIDKKNITIFDCLDYELNTSQKSLFCIYCKKKANINIISCIYSSPKIFVFLLNNGEFDEKLQNLNFNLETVVNLNKYIEDKRYPIKYDLIGIISMDINKKKYINYCKSFEDQNWYFFNDENFTQKTENEVKFDNNRKYIPSILFYKSIDG